MTVTPSNGDLPSHPGDGLRRPSAGDRRRRRDWRHRAAGVALARERIEVEVVEQPAEVREIGAELQVAANAMKALRHWGLEDEVREVSVASEIVGPAAAGRRSSTRQLRGSPRSARSCSLSRRSAAGEVRRIARPRTRGNRWGNEIPNARGALTAVDDA